ncbi:hypothetical protein [Eubacterium sp.]
MKKKLKYDFVKETVVDKNNGRTVPIITNSNRSLYINNSSTSLLYGR